MNAKYGLVVFLLVVFVILFVAIAALVYSNRYEPSYNIYILNKYPNRGEAKRLLNWLNQQGLSLINSLSEDYADNKEAMIIVNRLLYKYDPDKLTENDPIFTLGHKTYTTNFENVAICLRKKEGGFYPKDMLMFVYLHELAHIASLEKDHNDDFWRIFKFLLVAAEKYGILIPVDYSKKPFTYCGINVKHNPYFDGTDISNLTGTPSFNVSKKKS